jgi:hypothetical protein
LYTPQTSTSTTSPGMICLREASPCPVGVLVPDSTGSVIPAFSPPALAMAAIISP